MLVPYCDFAIVSRGNLLWNPANIKGANKVAKIYVGRSTTTHNLLFCVPTVCMNYVTNTFLLVSSSVRSKQLLCFVHGQGQKSEQTQTTKSFDDFHNHSIDYDFAQWKWAEIKHQRPISFLEPARYRLAVTKHGALLTRKSWFLFICAHAFKLS